jgi:sigma-E factor negative regulatory protein RseC
MAHTLQSLPAAPLLEGTARVVGREGGRIWLEPEPGTSCGGCAAAGACGAKGIGTPASRLAARRFSLDDSGSLALELGERVVVGTREDALLKGAMAAYGLPLLTLFAAGITAQALSGSDAVTLAASSLGLGLGILFARFAARRLVAGGRCAPRVLRRVSADQSGTAEGVQ